MATTSTSQTNITSGIRYSEIKSMQTKIANFQSALDSTMKKKNSITSQNSDLLKKAIRGRGVQKAYSDKEKELYDSIKALVSRLNKAYNILGKLKTEYENNVVAKATTVAFK